jgi:hypothetical protein
MENKGAGAGGSSAAKGTPAATAVAGALAEAAALVTSVAAPFLDSAAAVVGAPELARQCGEGGVVLVREAFPASQACSRRAWAP